MSEQGEWIKSSYSDGGGGNCVEWAPGLACGGSVPVRDSKDASRAHLNFSVGVWAAFVQGIRRGDARA